jgi:hypothetical protein
MRSNGPWPCHPNLCFSLVLQLVLQAHALFYKFSLVLSALIAPKTI